MLGPNRLINIRSHPVTCKSYDELPFMPGKFKCLGCWNKERAANNRVSNYYKLNAQINKLKKDLRNERKN